MSTPPAFADAPRASPHRLYNDLCTFSAPLLPRRTFIVDVRPAASRCLPCVPRSVHHALVSADADAAARGAAPSKTLRRWRAAERVWYVAQGDVGEAEYGAVVAGLWRTVPEGVDQFLLAGGVDAFSAQYPFACVPEGSECPMPDRAVTPQPGEQPPRSIREYPSEIEPGFLYLGSEKAYDAEVLANLGVTHVLRIHEKPNPPGSTPRGVIVLHIPLTDYEFEDLCSCLQTVIIFIERARQSGGRVLVHCAAGVSRSAAAVGAYLIVKHGISATKAVEYMQERRYIATPNAGFMRQLDSFAHKLGIH
eukprot:m51a1_g8176 putative dual specificity protein phosphatase 5 (307) ;mRNA; f:115744-117041